MTPRFRMELPAVLYIDIPAATEEEAKRYCTALFKQLTDGASPLVEDIELFPPPGFTEGATDGALFLPDKIKWAWNTVRIMLSPEDQ